MAVQHFSLNIAHHGENQILTIENPLATMSLSLRGAQIISFIPKKDQRERLWMSPINDFGTKRSIRGGIPVCWPWFANQRPNNDESLPMHGFLRTGMWQLLEISSLAGGGSLIKLKYDVQPQAGFEYHANVTLTITLNEQLKVELNTKNAGSEAFPVTMALHSYFAVRQLNNIELQGVSGSYRDKNRELNTFNTPSPYFIHRATDSIHDGDVANIRIVEESDITGIQNDGHDSAVIWNPGKEGAKSVANIPDEDYQHFICIESALTKMKMIDAGENHTLTQIIS
ncbi:MAG: D-hexose-6-phosphate mutarotase [Aestuariibacter sp.]